MTDRWTWHGGGIAAARRHFGGEDWLDLSTGINPCPWPGVDALAIDWQHLPEPEALAALEAAAARAFGVGPRHVCAVPGTEIGLRLVGSLIEGPARYGTPSYRTHGEMIAGADPIDASSIASHRGTLILANPNNPDGRIVAPSMLRDRRNGWLLVDEAFVDPDPSLSLASDVGEARQLMLFRSFGKFFGLAGVRLGFVLGPGAILDPLRTMLGAWPLSAPAIAIGTAAYRDDAWIAATRLRLHTEAEALDAILAKHGLRATGACPLFRLIEGADAATLFDRLARRAILTRPFADQPDWLRIGLPPGRDARDRLDAALADG